MYFEPKLIKSVLQIAQNSFTKAKIFQLLIFQLQTPPGGCLYREKLCLPPPLLKLFCGPC